MGNEMRVLGQRNAPVLVLLSSLGTTSQIFEPQIESFSKWLQVVTIEHPGHLGEPAVESDPRTVGELARRVLGLLDEQGIGRFCVCGISLGGIVAMELAYSYPERVDKLVLACTAPVLSPRSAWLERAQLVRERGPAILVDTLLSRWFPPGFDGAHPQVVARVAEMIGTVDSDGYAKACLAIADADLSQHIASIDAKTLVIAGRFDPVVPPGVALDYAMDIPGASFVTLAGSAHLPSLSEPELFAQLVLEHLVGDPRRRGRTARSMILGEDHVQASEADATPIDRPFLEFITEVAWGELWARPGLDQRARTLVTVALLAGLGRRAELELHLRSALRRGVPVEELIEVLLHVAVYAGVPVANEAFSLLKRIEAGG